MTTHRRTPEPTVLIDGLAYIESPRWHDGRLHLAHWGVGDVLAVNPDGSTDVVGHGPPVLNAARPGHGLGWSIEWLADGRLLITGRTLMRQETDGSMVPHADLDDISDFGWNEIVVCDNGNIYVNSIRFGLIAGEQPAAGVIALVRPDGSTQQVAEDLALPNGMVVTPDGGTLIVSESMAGHLSAFDIADDGSLHNRRVWGSPGLGPDGICLDADGAVWVQTANTPAGSIVRMTQDGTVLDRIDCDRTIFAATLGGDDEPILYLMTAEFRGVEHVAQAMADRTGRVLAVPAPAPRAHRS